MVETNEQLFPMRILHIASGMPEFDTAVRVLGYQSMRFELSDIWNSMAIGRLNATVEWRPHLVFLQAQRHMDGLNMLLDRYRANGSAIVSWTGDVREPIPSFHYDRAPHVDITAFASPRDAEEFAKAGHRSIHLLPGYDPAIYHDNEDNVRSGIVFVGNDYGNRFPLSLHRRRIVKALQESLTLRHVFVAYGRGFGQALLNGGDAGVYRRAAVAINVEHFDHPGYRSDRWLRIRACGVPMVDATRLDPADTVLEVCARLEDDEAMDVARGLATYTRENDTWESRIDSVIEQLIAY